MLFWNNRLIVKLKVVFIMKKGFSSVTMFSATQWLFFIFANTVVVPISVANAFGVPSESMATMLRISLVFTGLACILQGKLGHRLPLMEGHSGLLWGVILNLGLSAHSIGMNTDDIGGGIATGILAACLSTLLLVACNGIGLLQRIFSPMVMTVYLFLLTFQLIFIFFKGMLPVHKDGTLDIGISLYSLGLVVFVSVLKVKGNKTLSNFSILIGLMGGWAGFALLFPGVLAHPAHVSNTAFSIFPLGMPNLQIGIAAVTFFATMMNLSNTVASIQAGADLLKESSSEKQYRNSILVTTFSTAAGSLFGLVPYTPFTSSIGFLQSTRIFERKPFLLGGALLMVMGIVPSFGTFMTTMPITVGNAVLFVAYLQMFGTAFHNLKGRSFNSNTIFRLAMPLLLGVSLMNTPTELFRNLPVLLQPFLSNGLIMGVIISIGLERTVNWQLYEQIEN
ncbi:uracil/xanthine transporter [Ectobacillus sp. JY-23]|uniref:uracil/xanthine transporter n=1 Tax=Ectobacillus sp. JY-23 TaxID=2933872 RepID=UPI001FF10705|nr:uracil/xanthine transporter [Ectobacillus sp. JY-23]UOY93305.1 uracil/xanthine transporter [Ectobacillus sp. JY-23]